jgi:hypothetical protein
MNDTSELDPFWNFESDVVIVRIQRWKIDKGSN